MFNLRHFLLLAWKPTSQTSQTPSRRRNSDWGWELAKVRWRGMETMDADNYLAEGPRWHMLQSQNPNQLKYIWLWAYLGSIALSVLVLWVRDRNTKYDPMITPMPSMISCAKGSSKAFYLHEGSDYWICEILDSLPPSDPEGLRWSCGSVKVGWHIPSAQVPCCPALHTTTTLAATRDWAS